MASLWERMLTEERRQHAAQLGMSVAELEEQQNLLLTLAESKQEESAATLLQANSPEVSERQWDEKESRVSELEAECEDEFSQTNVLTTAEEDTLNAFIRDHEIHHNAEIAKTGGPWYRLPQVLVDYILLYVGDPDVLGYLLIASKVTFQPSEKVYKFLCEQIYPRQTQKKVCRIERWKSWRSMLVNRPRLRTNGIYTMRTMFSKAHANDAFWEEKSYESIEVKYYRHFRFFNDGHVLYSLDVIEPYEIIKVMERGVPIPKKVFAGRYTLTRNELRVEVRLHYCSMAFDLLLLDGDDGFQGKHNMLKLIRHTSIVGGGHRMQHLVEYPIPLYADYRFYRFWHLEPNAPNPALFLSEQI